MKERRQIGEEDGEKQEREKEKEQEKIQSLVVFAFFFLLSLICSFSLLSLQDCWFAVPGAWATEEKPKKRRNTYGKPFSNRKLGRGKDES